MTNKSFIVGISIGVVWVFFAGIDLFGWVGEGWAGGWGFLWYLYLAPVVAILCGIVVGTIAKENRAKAGVKGVAITLTMMVLGFFILFFINQLKVQFAVRNAEQSEQEFWKQVEENEKLIEAEKWFETDWYRFQYDKERWSLYIDDNDQKIFVRERPSRFAPGHDDLSALGSYISIRSGEGELPVEGLDAEIVLNGKTAFVREEILEQGKTRKTYAFPSSDNFFLWWFSQYPYVEGSEDSRDFEEMVETLGLK